MTNPFDEIKKVFHEPNRLAIMSALLRAPEGLSFADLKAACRLTDGNLSRHLKALADLNALKMKKSFVGVKPRTTVYVTDRGRDHFLRYLAALEEVLHAAQTARSKTADRHADGPDGATAAAG